jgi:NDP-sugar pyrophosphorylase family protein
VHRLLGAGEKVVGFPFSGYWQDLGRPDDYEQAAIDFNVMHDRFLPGENHYDMENSFSRSEAG